MKRLLSMLLAVFILVPCFSSVYADEEKTWEKVDMSYVDSLETFSRNPGRGKSTGTWYILGRDTPPTDFSYTTGLAAPKFDLSRYSAGNDYTQSGYSCVAWNKARVGGVDKEIGDYVLKQLEACFAAAEKQGVQVIPRFAYAWDAYVGAEPDDFTMIERHIEQICTAINKYKDTVISVECGIIGPWGEMHSSKYREPEYERRVVKAYLDNLHEDITLQTRTASFITQYHGDIKSVDFMKGLPIKADDPIYRMGMYNDGYLGTDSDYGTWWGDANLSRENGIIFLREQNKRIPYGGEMAYNTIAHAKENGTPIYNDDFVKELYYTHLSYLDNITYMGHAICSELTRIYLSERHVFEGLPDVSAYYGQSLQKFMLDHMGYRFVLRSAETTATVDPGTTVSFRGKVENVGFGNLLAGMTAELIIVAPNGTYNAVPVSIDPQKWYSAQISEYSVTLTVPKSLKAGKYNAFLRFGTVGYKDAASSAATIKFANKQPVTNVFGGNYIGSFSVTSNMGGDASTFAQLLNVTYLDTDGVTVLKEEKGLKYGDATSIDIIPSKASDEKYTYVFDYWQDQHGDRADLDSVTEDLRLTPVFKGVLKKYTVTFFDEEGEYLGESTVDYGTAAISPGAPPKSPEGYYVYKFDCWADAEGNKVDITSVTENIAVYAKYKAYDNRVTVTFMNSTEVHATVQVIRGEAVTLPEPPKSPGAPVQYIREEFVCWVDNNGVPADLSSVSEDMVVYASYEGVFDHGFRDVDMDDYYGEALKYCMLNGIINGVSKTSFAPKTTVNRAMIVTVLYRLQDSPDVSGLTEPFDDVDESDWYYDAVKWAYNNGVVNGTAPHRYSPLDTLTREQLSTVLFRYTDSVLGEATDFDEAALDRFNDKASVSTYAYAAMGWAVENGYIGGVSADTLSPKTGATRAQLVTILHRFMAK